VLQTPTDDRRRQTPATVTSLSPLHYVMMRSVADPCDCWVLLLACTFLRDFTQGLTAAGLRRVKTVGLVRMMASTRTRASVFRGTPATTASMLRRRQLMVVHNDLHTLHYF